MLIYSKTQGNAAGSLFGGPSNSSISAAYAHATAGLGGLSSLSNLSALGAAAAVGGGGGGGGGLGGGMGGASGNSSGIDFMHRQAMMNLNSYIPYRGGNNNNNSGVSEFCRCCMIA